MTSDTPPAGDGYDRLLADLAAEQGAVDALVLPATLDRPTIAAAWTVGATVAHLHASDRAALVAVTDPPAFDALRARLAHRDRGGHGDEPVGGELLEAWRTTRAALQDALGALAGRDRVAWFGPPMSARSFATARLMEYWAHGEDVALAVGHPLPATRRLRHVAHLGVLTRRFSFVVRGEEPPAASVLVDLEAPDGTRWTWGPPDATEVVRGPARHFCLVVTQRRHLADTALEVVGPGAGAWLRVAQAFAGAATVTAPERRGLPTSPPGPSTPAAPPRPGRRRR